MPVIEMRTTYAGPDGVCSAGDEMKVDSATAKRLIDAGFAVKPGADQQKPEAKAEPEAAAEKPATTAKTTKAKTGPQ